MIELARTKKNRQLLEDMSSRLSYLVNECLDISIEDCSRLMGYANSSPLRKAMVGQCFIDSEKMVVLSTVKNSKNQSANLHWLMTGRGKPLLTDNFELDNLLAKLNLLPEHKVKAIIQLLDL